MAPPSDLKMVIGFDPVNPALAQYTPALFARIRDFARDVIHHENPEFLARKILTRVFLKDESILVAIVIRDGQIVAHGVGELATINGTKRGLFVSQVKCDIPGVLDIFLNYGDNWCMARGLTLIRIESPEEWSEELSERIYQRRGFKLISRVWEREV